MKFEAYFSVVHVHVSPERIHQFVCRQMNCASALDYSGFQLQLEVDGTLLQTYTDNAFYGGASDENDIDVSGGANGNIVGVSFQGGVIPAGVFTLTVLDLNEIENAFAIDDSAVLDSSCISAATVSSAGTVSCERLRP